MQKDELDSFLDELMSIDDYLQNRKNKKRILLEGTYSGKIELVKNEINHILSILYKQEMKFEEDELEIVEYYTKKLKYKNTELYSRQTELEAAHSQLKAYTEEIERINCELNRRVKELRNLFYFSQDVTSNFDKNELLKKALEDIIPFVNSSFGAVFVSQKEGLELVDTYYKDSEIYSIFHPILEKYLKNGYLDYDISLEATQIYSHIRKYPNVPQSICDQLTDKLKAGAIIPVFNKKKEVNAVIVLLGEYFDGSEKYLFNCYANVLGIALENAKLYNDKHQMFFDTVKVLANAIEVKDTYTKGHVDRVTKYSTAIAKKLNFDKNRLEKVRIAAVLHDIGKIGIPDEILNKPARLTEDEFNIIKLHPLKGYEIIKDIPALKDISIHVKQHHERIDGKGYPEGLKANQISLEAKIISVADAFDAMTSDRPYRKGMNIDKAINILVNNRGSQFDEYVVDTFLNYFQENDNIIKENE
ncbi:HD-GYP domain-containing protein [Defluviitalea saccharophila]|uniref:HD-GYP domain-containing protein n=1 Tax=Defluviitalea saccharophila TaxID=879970 RepID=A0ABZ2Y763_9FIRM